MGSVSNNNLRPCLTAWQTQNACIPPNSDLTQVVTSGVTTWNFTAGNGVPSLTSIPEWQVFDFVDHATGNKHCSITVVNDPVNSYSITHSTGSGSPLPTVGATVTQNYYHSANLNDDNETTLNVQNVASTPTWSNTQTYAPSSITAVSFTSGGTPTAATPTFSPVAGTYTGTQNVTVSCSTGPTACYSLTTTPATNGTTGCTTGTLYMSPVPISSTSTLHAICGGTGFLDGTPATAAYTINPPPTVSGSAISGGVTISGGVSIH